MYAPCSSEPVEPSQAGLVLIEAQPLLKPYSDAVICTDDCQQSWPFATVHSITTSGSCFRSD